MTLRASVWLLVQICLLSVGPACFVPRILIKKTYGFGYDASDDRVESRCDDTQRIGRVPEVGLLLHESYSPLPADEATGAQELAVREALLWVGGRGPSRKSELRKT